MMRFCLAGEMLQSGRLDEAIVEFTRGLGINPLYPDAHFGMAIAFDMKGNTAKAEQHYRQAWDLNPGKADIHLYYASLLERSGNPEGAEEQLRLALRLQRESPAAREALCRVLKMSGVEFELPLFPACGNLDEWWTLDKPVTNTYVENEKR